MVKIENLLNDKLKREEMAVAYPFNDRRLDKLKKEDALNELNIENTYVELQMDVLADLEKNVIKLTFGTSLTWFAFSKNEAESFIKILQEKIKKLKD